MQAVGLSGRKGWEEPKAFVCTRVLESAVNKDQLAGGPPSGIPPNRNTANTRFIPVLDCGKLPLTSVP